LEKIKAFIKKSNQQEKLEFTQGLLNFANKIDKKFLTEGLLPNLRILVNLEIIFIYLGVRKLGHQKSAFRPIYSFNLLH